MSENKKLVAKIEKLKKQLEIANNRIKSANYGIVWIDIPEVLEKRVFDKIAGNLKCYINDLENNEIKQ